MQIVDIQDLFDFASIPRGILIEKLFALRLGILHRIDNSIVGSLPVVK